MSGFQIHFANHEIFTPGDRVDALVAMNPAALITNLGDLNSGGILIVNKDAFERKDLQQAGYAAIRWRMVAWKLPLVPGRDDKAHAAGRRRIWAWEPRRAIAARNFFAMGLAFWLYDRPLEPTSDTSTKSSARSPRSPRPIAGRSCRLQLRRNDRGVRRPYAVPRPSCRPARIAISPAIRRWLGD